MKYLLFVIFSSVEFFSIGFLGLVLFRFRLRLQYFYKLTINSVVLSVLSTIFILLNLDVISPFLLMAAMIILMRINFQTKILYTTLIVVSSYFLYGLIQTIFILITNYYKLITFKELIPFTFKGYIIQLISFIITMLVTWILKRTNEGYAFIPEEQLKTKYKYSNKVIIIIISLSAIISSGMYFEYRSTNLFYFFIISFVCIFVATASILFISLKRDKEEFE